MRTTITQKMMLLAIMMVAGAGNLSADVSDAFAIMTKEGVMMTFMINDENLKTCSVGNESEPCIDMNATGTITIPEQAMGYTVNKISNNAFSRCSITEVGIPQTVEEIGVWTFEFCTNLKKCWLPEKLKVIDAFTFQGCSSLEDVYIPHNVYHIRQTSFANCSSLKRIVIPASVIYLGARAFSNCQNLQTVVFLGAECPSFESDVFQNTRTFSFSGETYSDVTFVVPNRESCQYDEVIPQQISRLYPPFVTIHHGLEYTGGDGVYDRSTLGYMTNILFSFNDISNQYQCLFNGIVEEADIEIFTVPEKILGFPIVTLLAYSNLESNKERLKAVDIPASLTSLGYQAFKNCLNLADVKIRNAHVQLFDDQLNVTDDNEAFDLNTERYAELTAPKGSDDYYSKAPWTLWFSKINFDLPNGATSIAEGTPAVYSQPSAIYDLQGRRQSALRRGFNILHMSDGSTHKTVRK